MSLLLLLSVALAAEPAVDHSKPTEVVAALFKAADTRDFTLLAGLCDPRHENDGDTDCVCALAPGYEPHKCPSESHNRLTADDYVKNFAGGKVNGEPKILKEQAAVSFTTPTFSETMSLVARDGLWYLSSF